MTNMNRISESDYGQHYSDSGFWHTVRTHRSLSFLPDAAAMFYCLKDPQTPAWVKTLIIGALGYFILPADAVPDLLPLIGWLDDAGIIAAVIAAIRAHVRPEHQQHANALLGG
jgi:uncharacterized membrane protein YkvA (DUF1232 family)